MWGGRGAARDRRGERGAALIDVLVGLVLLGIMSAGLFWGFSAALGSWGAVQQYAGAQQNARAALDRMARSLRMAGYNQPPNTGPAIIYGDAHEVDFFADLAGTGTAQCYRFALQAGTVVEAEAAGSGCAAAIRGAPGTPLLASREAQPLQVSDLEIAYYSGADLGGGLLAVPLSATDLYHVVRIEITLALQGQPPQGPVSLTTDAVIRQTGMWVGP
jgi:Tfp pilus assembly protein PilW